MKSIGHAMTGVINNMSPEAAFEVRKALRTSKIKTMWKELVEEAILEHTNGVYVINEEDRLIMHVYVDESIYAAELNNRRELLLLICHQKYGEAIEELHIHLSYGLMKQRYPFKDKPAEKQDAKPPIPLSAEEREEIKQLVSVVEKESLRVKLEKAMIADLEWKKGNLQ
ncbi:MAG: DUF721 domain-containing protein [Eggerthellaceae bacterium]|nr:DUF721 domain-containing protein [Eggerthellaceae bacterium]